MAIISKTIVVRGDVVGDEDMHIEGQVEGTIALPNHTLNIAAGARVNATVTVRAANVAGDFDGNVQATESVVLRSGARVRGNISARSVALEDGNWFCGTIDMEPEESESTPDLSSTSTSSVAAESNRSDEAA